VRKQHRWRDRSGHRLPGARRAPRGHRACQHHVINPVVIPRCVRIAPLGSPVLPEVKAMQGFLFRIDLRFWQLDRSLCTAAEPFSLMTVFWVGSGGLSTMAVSHSAAAT